MREIEALCQGIFTRPYILLTLGMLSWKYKSKHKHVHNHIITYIHTYIYIHKYVYVYVDERGKSHTATWRKNIQERKKSKQRFMIVVALNIS